MESSRPACASSGEDKLLDVGVGERGNDLRGRALLDWIDKTTTHCPIAKV